MKFGNAFRSGLAVIAVALVTSAAKAAPLYFFGNAPTAAAAFPTDPSSPPRAASTAFGNAIEVTLSESFETRAPGALSGAAYSGSNSMTIFGLGNTLSQVAPINPLQGARVRGGTQFSGRFNTTGGLASGRWLETDSNFAIDLAQGVGALSFYGTDFGDFDGTLTIALYDVLNGVERLIQSNIFTDASGAPLQPRTTTLAQDGSLLFFGFASDVAFNRIVFSVAQGGGELDYLGFDDIMVGNLRTTTPPPTPAPEPGSLALVGLALFAAGWARKTQRRA